MCFARRSGAGTAYQATWKVLLNEILKPFAISQFNIIQKPFNSVQQVERMLKQMLKPFAWALSWGSFACYFESGT